jgi:Domain of unknown function (DUF4372)/Transposase DDE domain
MVRHASLFSQLVALFNRQRFHELVFRHGSERYAKGFSSWDQFVAMLFCQIAQAKSLREISGGLASSLGKLRHLGVKAAPNKSTLSYANAHRPWQLFQDLFYETLHWCQLAAPGKISKFRFKNKLLSLDSSTISLCLSLFPWAKFRRTKGAVKLHLLLDHDGYLPSFACITDGKKADVNIARVVSLAPGSIIVMDRGYNGYELLANWTRTGVNFVTRLKDNADYIVIEQHPIAAHKHIVSDETIFFAAKKAQKKCPFPLRRIVVTDPDSGKAIALLTNHFEFAASTIGAIYKDRWQIELFFKALKQNLRVKTFVGTTENALYIQIWTALIAMLLIKFMRFKAAIAWSLSNLVAFLRWNLFTYRDLWQWLDRPQDTPPLEPPPSQQPLPLRGLGQHMLPKMATSP